jgi:hypothetical protein
MLFKAGRLMIVSPTLKTLTVIRPKSIKYSRKNTKVEAYGFPFSDVGAQVKTDSAIVKSDWLFEFTQEAYDQNLGPLIHNQQSAVSPSIQLPGPTTKLVVPASGAFEVLVTGLTADQDCYATVVSDTTPTQLTQVKGATAIAAGNFKVTSGTVTFHSTLAGATIAFFYLETKTSLRVQGGNTPILEYGDCFFVGQLAGTRTNEYVYFPKLSPQGDFEAGVEDKAIENKMVYDALTPSDWPLPYVRWAAA